MDHTKFENDMIDEVNRNAEENADRPYVFDIPVIDRPVTKEKDIRVLLRGVKRTVIALCTILSITSSVYGFIAVAKATGYIAIAIFMASIFLLLASGILLYAQGITIKGKVSKK